MGEGMNAEPMKEQDVATARAIEMPHWAPPEAPMDMPRQEVEAPRAARVSLGDLVMRILMPGQRA
ncbi:hypothetical protein SAMN04488245_108228 [Alloyangia pacifica]|uniref:Uncharacterized protein n=2 Tax=Alloyangia pacifica TaxID=311180 RepID=A0A1I6NTX6_9RHOB|nr:hypothetical protein SAMN04488245_108228 [Alloyangia pacifica]SFS31335.1 hypothetical protein SAMN04488050_10175 [Alloyangia pacifica]